MPQPLRTIVGPLLVAAFVGLAGGCWSYQPGGERAGVGGSEVAADAWPARDPGTLGPYLERTPAEVRTFRLWSGVDPDAIPSHWPVPVPIPVEAVVYRVVYKGIHGMSLLRIYEPLPGAPESSESRRARDRIQEVVNGFVPNAALMTSRTLAAIRKAEERSAQLNGAIPASPSPEEGAVAHAPPREETGRGIPAPSLAQGASTHSPTAPPPTLIEPIESAPTKSRPPLPTGPASMDHVIVDDEVHLFSGKPARIPLPKSAPACGVLIHFQSLVGNDYERRVLDEFRRRGWAVFDLATESGVDPPLSPERIEQVRDLRTQAILIWREIVADTERRFPLAAPGTTQDPEALRRLLQRRSSFVRSHPKRVQWQALVARAIEQARGSFQVCGPDDVEPVAARIAAEVDQALAGNAYAAEAVVDYIRTAREDLRGLPIVLIGFSAGALAAPAVAARLHGDLAAVVVIGGGANLFMLAQESTLTDGGLRLRCGDNKPSKQLTRQVGEAYLRFSKLDPYWTGPSLAGLPVLQVHASLDDVVPASWGDLLWERLGRPDRLTIRAGHELLFYFLPGRARFIADWVERHAFANAEPTGSGDGESK